MSNDVITSPSAGSEWRGLWGHWAGALEGEGCLRLLQVRVLSKSIKGIPGEAAADVHNAGFMPLLCSSVIGIFGGLLLFYVFFFFSHLSPAAVGVKALWLIKFKGIGAADVDIVVASSQGRFWM